MKQIIVIGGGISGLAAAYAVEQLAARENLAVKTTVLEKAPYPGGKIRSIREEGFLCEWGPNGFLDNKPNTLELCEQLAISARLLRSDDNARKRFIYSDAQLHRLPESGPAFLKSKLISWPGKFRLAGEFLIPPRHGDADETLADFARRRLGSEALDKLIAPMVSGIFAGDPEQMSLASCFPRIRQLEQEYGGLLKAMVKLARQKRAEKRAGKQVASAAGPGGVLTSFEAGIQELTNALAAALKGDLRCASEVTGVTALDGGYRVSLADGGQLEADLVLCAAPAYAVRDLLQPLLPELGPLLTEIPYAVMNVVCFGYRRDKIPRPLDGFGYLIPRREGRHTLGTLWDSSIFPNRAPEGMVLLRSMLGGATNPSAIDLAESEVIRQVRDDLQRIMGITAEPDFIRVFRHRRAIPQYRVGHGARLKSMQELLAGYPGLFLSGNAFFGVGLNDCVNASTAVAMKMINFVRQREGS